MRPSRPLALLVLAAAGGLLAGAHRTGAAPASLRLAPYRLELAGVPVAVLSVDFDRDGLRDLAVVTASTDWGQIGIEERTAVDESGALAEVMTVVPALLDRRALAIHLGRAGGGFVESALRLELPAEVHAIEAGPASAPLLAWTDDGVSEVLAARAPDEAGALVLAPRIAARTLFAGTSSFVPRPGLAHDLDGDGERDLLVPVEGGLALHLSSTAGIAAAPASTVPVPLEERLPGDARHYRNGVARRVPLPEVRDLDGDRLPDLVFRAHEGGYSRSRLLFNRGRGRFGPPVDPLGGAPPGDGIEVVWIGDLDGDGRGELVTSEGPPEGRGSLREGLARARRPRSRVRIHRLGPGGAGITAPAGELALEGHAFPLGGEGPIPGGFLDLDGDGRLELVAVTLDFSILEAARAVTARAVEIGLEFAVWRQSEPLRFRRVPGAAPAGELRLRLDRAALGQLSSFAGDFDGDGRADFFQAGPGRRAAVRLGRPGARFAQTPDLALELARAPSDALLVRLEDLDGDGACDLAIPYPGGGEVGRRAALDLYLSRGSR